MIEPSIKNSLLLSVCSLVFSATCLNAEIYVKRFGPDGVTEPQLIAELDTVVSSVYDRAPEYWSINSSNTDILFIRHIISSLECEYWFRADATPDNSTYLDIEYHSNVYWFAECLFVDGAQNGSNNFVMLHSTVTNELVAVLQYALNGSIDINAPASLIAYAVGFDNFTYEDAIRALAPIPEPTTVTLLSAGAAALLTVAVRRRKAKA